MSDASVFDEDGLSPDEVMVPEGRSHRRVAELCHVAVTHALGSAWQVDANLNWYPLDGGGPVAPDVMVLPAGAGPPDARSYQQGPADPSPSAVIVVPSASDDVLTFRAKLRRLLSLGAVVYVAYADLAEVERFTPADENARRWLGQPCDELGGIVFQVVDGMLGIWLGPDLVATSAPDLVGQLRSRADEAAARAERLAAQLRASGLDPEA